jgi:hypothetical protein
MVNQRRQSRSLVASERYEYDGAGLIDRKSANEPQNPSRQRTQINEKSSHPRLLEEIGDNATLE